jgi:hypothetical protein
VALEIGKFIFFILKCRNFCKNNIGGKKMKTRGLVFSFISVLTVIALTGGCATVKKAISEEDFFETWSGTWVNTDFAGNAVTPQKFVTHPDGTFD